IYYTYGAASPTYENITGAGSMMYAFCTNANITNVSVEDGDGIRLFYTSYANITANVTNCLNGIEGYYSTDGQLVGCNVDTSSRGKWGIKLYESP
ncbi:MAG: hypothetical protein GWN18_03260, partial [Thermoplasmata archaeon]|nr:hypothetical protein [Thermoplasmata archaeon]NIS14605.1 hypothetical protein [Thermoplasmata archaeon]NIS18976.1 hypothetical protein [Thermoplasmata archaeon]NIT80352.1 hypothetical protein [Thermoplasmata archaeon]NIU48126.1 hypothetical protein [Thermoplasmata archaeon]